MLGMVEDHAYDNKSSSIADTKIKIPLLEVMMLCLRPWMVTEFDVISIQLLKCKKNNPTDYTSTVPRLYPEEEYG